ncbi:MAG TPA: hypothetical protein VHC43_16740 [Mycobacteriales bacterium]|nr:hypothetical protein [Mycobacteriales bacterium]
MRKSLVSCALAVTAAVGAAGCGGSSSGGAPAAKANPQADPKATVTAFIAALKSGDIGSVCNYVQMPSGVSGSCPDLLGQALAGRGAFSGNAAVGNDAVSGNEALVVTTGSFSAFGTAVKNSDPNAGLPSGGTSFAAAYSAAQADPKSPDVCLLKVGSDWFVSPSTG